MAVSPKIRDAPPVTDWRLRCEPPRPTGCYSRHLRLHPCYLPRIQRREKRLQKQFRPFCTGSYARPIGRLHLPLDKETDLTFDLQYLGRGKIYWTEANDAAQNFYGLVNASIILSGKYADLKLWGKNLLNQHYQAFYFETMNAENLSMPNSFVQCGRPITFGADITIKF